MAERIRPFISATNRVDMLGRLVREHSEQVSRNVSDLIYMALDDGNEKRDGKGGGKDSGEAGFWDKKDGKEGKDKEKDGKESKEAKEGKDDKEGKEAKDAKEGKEGKEAKDAKEGKDGKDKEGDKEGKDKDKEQSDRGDKYTGSENLVYRYGDEIVLPAETFDLIAEVQSIRVAALLNQPIF
ncbi:hypothetical protein [Streptomyces sp. F001]|uniref:hypothetical protein n=1 Tax=Streptomyces sp. F001 TaxID=1510026 RepID=UPI00101E2A41|nr:hypothetical protein [Streptomyces sp. F001]